MKKAISAVLVFLCAGCATVSDQPKSVEAPFSRQEQQQAQAKAMKQTIKKRYKQKIAVIRFTNETNYGRALFTDAEYDSIGKQASDILIARLIQSGNFLVFERSDMAKLQKEQEFSGDAKMVGVDAVVTGAVTEFGRAVNGKRGFLSKTKVQEASAKVDIRLTDVKTGYNFFSATGAGKATNESGSIAGYGSHAAYDGTLNDSAIEAAISDVVDGIIRKLEDRPWKTDVLEVQEGNVFISGGELQGVKVGDVFDVMKKAKAVKSKQTGFEIELPATKVAQIKVLSLFGDNETNQGSVCEVVSGTVDTNIINSLFVIEEKKA